ncbi:HEAT repeat domain-containing protein [Streptomyces sp. AM8-1-1]|uniref:HEAT repeat domain-containing protein n=1 Tax=Streptomyces sp. AM8-1-1 TaxID=3075825 RepID=UPI0028C43EC9|nr:HEAT repeat domain-containing protein [Streptomyces sp. AM8-1-1]WNO70420.1 HEAT repeat domain-containing protein [Streptomyces sp. AM8-1-1]
MGADHQIAFFLRELAAPEPWRRVAAAKGLGRIGRYEQVQALIHVGRDADPAVRAAAALGLGRLGAPGADDVLISLMRDPDAQVRRRAALAVQRLALKGPAVIDAFARLLRDSDRHVRLNALTGLTRLKAIGDRKAVVLLLGDPDWRVWGHARCLVETRMDDDLRAEVLHTARQGPGAARARALDMLPSRYTHRLRDSLLEGLHNPAFEVREAVVGKLVDLKERGTAGLLLTTLQDERHPDVARRLLRALGRLGERRLLAAALPWLDHPDVGPVAVDVLADIGTPTAVRQIRSVLTQWPCHPAIQAAAAKALGELGDRKALELLLPLLNDEDKEVRSGALTGLGRLGHHQLPPADRRRVVETLMHCLVSDPQVLWHTGSALRSYPEVLPWVRGLLEEAAPDVRATALSLLDDGDEADGRLFLTYLSDPDDDVRYQAAIGLGRYAEEHGVLPPGGDAAIGVLTALTSDASGGVRWAAARVLRALETPDAGP